MLVLISKTFFSNLGIWKITSMDLPYILRTKSNFDGPVKADVLILNDDYYL